ncbi:MAG: hypothetical protein AAF430_03585 [Myxococcota bacterium]
MSFFQPQRLRGLTACVIACLGVACASNPNQNPYDSSERLAELVARWRHVQENGWACEENAARETPVVDCERIRIDLERLALEFPRDVPVLLANAVVSYQVKRYQRSQMFLDALFDLERVHADAAVLRTRLAVREGNLRFARRFVDEQIELTPDHGELREARAAVRYLAKDYDGAARDLEAALELGVPESRIAYHQGLVAEAAGRLDDAKFYYGRAVSLNPGGSPAASRLRGLRLESTPRSR